MGKNQHSTWNKQQDCWPGMTRQEEGKFFPVQTIKAYGWSGDIYKAPITLNLTQHGSEWSSSWPGQFTPGDQIPRCKLTRRLGGPHSQAGHFGEEKKSLAPGWQNNLLTNGWVTDITLTLRRLMSYIYGAPILDVSRSHTMTQHSR